MSPRRRRRTACLRSRIQSCRTSDPSSPSSACALCSWTGPAPTTTSSTSRPRSSRWTTRRKARSYSTCRRARPPTTSLAGLLPRCTLRRCACSTQWAGAVGPSARGSPHYRRYLTNQQPPTAMVRAPMPPAPLSRPRTTSSSCSSTRPRMTTVSRLSATRSPSCNPVTHRRTMRPIKRPALWRRQRVARVSTVRCTLTLASTISPRTPVPSLC
mmetsp:Transcript_16310/g.32821  ORF Transcript_16310/g.32821 Transcript_16310/m.32821 type:complete len:213 (-) Transcript_16310:1250-1888(-)